jgi:ferrochelatase
MQTSPKRTGVLLVNLGTPDSPTPKDLRRYLREFLSDPRVLTMPAAARWLLLNLIILPTRPRRSAEAYQQIWQEDGSPLLTHGVALREQVERALGEGFVTELAMRYGNPDIASALARLSESSVERCVVVPLFPQYSEAATGSALARVHEVAKRDGHALELLDIRDFHDDPGFILPTADLARPLLRDFRPDHVLLSYHGLPESQLRGARTGCLESADCCARITSINHECYRAQCYATTAALQRALDLSEQQCTTAFQSRLGRARWIQPYTTDVVEQLAAAGTRRLAVLCPAFVADCLETLEEIGMRLREQWQDEDCLLCPGPNADPAFAEGLAALIRQRAAD